MEWKAPPAPPKSIAGVGTDVHVLPSNSRIGLGKVPSASAKALPSGLAQTPATPPEWMNWAVAETPSECHRLIRPHKLWHPGSGPGSPAKKTLLPEVPETDSSRSVRPLGTSVQL